MQKMPRWMKSVLRTAEEDLPPLPFVRDDMRHGADGTTKATSNA